MCSLKQQHSFNAPSQDYLPCSQFIVNLQLLIAVCFLADDGLCYEVPQPLDSVFPLQVRASDETLSLVDRKHLVFLLLFISVFPQVCDS